MEVLKDSSKGKWFSELGQLWPGQAMSLEVEEVLYEGRSDYQDVLVFKSKSYGTVLVLDGAIQVTERDEHAYQEMIAHIPLNAHPNPERVLVIGGGDGGVLREVVKHPKVKEVTICEIDAKVIELSKKYLPQTAIGYEDPKVTTFVGDGFKFMGEHQDHFDVIITDSSDPIGPASSLFEKEYYALMKSALRDGGMLSTQGECIWLHLELISGMLEFCSTLFPVVDYAFTTIPTYPSGQIGFVLCSKNSETDFSEPLTKYTDEELDAMKMKYYSTQVHRGAFVLPRFAHKALKQHRSSQNK
eukprot:Nk52_evm6s236 gene=Nk52_evmTU6s236